MLPENAIEVKNITKKFKVYIDKGNTLKEKVLFKKRRAFEEREVLKGISFNVKKGEAIRLVAPMTLVGLTALSVETITNFSTPNSMAKSATNLVPNTLT